MLHDTTVIARHQIAGLMMPSMLSLRSLQLRLAPPFPDPPPPLLRPEMLVVVKLARLNEFEV